MDDKFFDVRYIHDGPLTASVREKVQALNANHRTMVTVEEVITTCKQEQVHALLFDIHDSLKVRVWSDGATVRA